jgi:Ribonuclease P 40kDa (Rpp40) subunit
LLQEKLDLGKLREELKDLVPETSVNFLWTPQANDVCPSSVAKYFSDASHNIKLCKNKFLETPEYGLKFPTITDDEFCFPEISEYIGMVLLGCNVGETDFSSYRIPDDNVDIGRGKVIHSKGFIAQKTIQQVIDEARRILDENSSFPWIALSLILPETSSKLFLITKDKIHSL